MAVEQETLRKNHLPQIKEHVVFQRNGNGNGNGFHKPIEYSPLLPQPEDKSILEIVLENKGMEFVDLPSVIARTLIITDGLKYPIKEGESEEKPLSISDKFRIAGYALWQETGRFADVKEYLGESEVQRWELILEHVWDRDDLVEIFNKFEEDRDFYEEFAGSNTKNKNFLIAVNFLKEKEESGVSRDEMLSKKEEIVRGLERIYRGRKLKEKKEETIKQVDPHVAVEMKKKEGKTIEQISFELKINRDRVERIISALILETKLEPVKNAKTRSDEFVQFCKDVEKISKEHPDWRYKDLVKYFNFPIQRVRRARMVLIEAGRLPNAKHLRSPNRDDKAEADDKAILELRKTNPKLSYDEISETLNVPLSRVKHYIHYAIARKEVSSLQSLKRASLEKKLNASIKKHLKTRPERFFYFEPVSRELGTSSETLKKVFLRMRDKYPDLKTSIK